MCMYVYIYIYIYIIHIHACTDRQTYTRIHRAGIKFCCRQAADRLRVQGAFGHGRASGENSTTGLDPPLSGGTTCLTLLV